MPVTRAHLARDLRAMRDWLLMLEDDCRRFRVDALAHQVAEVVRDLIVRLERGEASDDGERAADG